MSRDGRGYTQGSSSYSEYDAKREQEEHDRIKASKCTCRNSPFGMDVDRCPVHGEGCA